MKRSIIMLAVVALFAILTGVATVAHADQAPSGSKPSCGQNGPNGADDYTFPNYSGGKWLFSFHHNCPNNKSAFGEIQVSTDDLHWTDVQGIHQFFTSTCDTSGGNYCWHAFSITVACSDPLGNKFWRAQFWTYDSSFASPEVSNEC